MLKRFGHRPFQPIGERQQAGRFNSYQVRRRLLTHTVNPIPFQHVLSKAYHLQVICRSRSTTHGTDTSEGVLFALRAASRVIE